MSFSYDLDTEVGKVRLKINDKAAATAQFTDEEIEYYLSVESSVNAAAAACLEALAVIMASMKTEESIEGYSYKRSPGDLLAAAKELRARDAEAPYCYVMSTT